MPEMARAEMKEIEAQLEEMDDKIKVLRLPKDPNNDRNCMLEIKAGTGGLEANIFAGECYFTFDAWVEFCMMFMCSHLPTFESHPENTTYTIIKQEGDLYDVYCKFMAIDGWKVSMIDSSAGNDGGYKNLVLKVKGDSMYSKLKWEAGVHRVQR